MTPGIALDSALPHRLLVELPFPSSVRTINAILFAYLNEARPPAHATFVLDVSGSMADDNKIDHLKDALRGLTGLDQSLTGRLSVFHSREQLTFIPFSGTVHPAADFTITGTDTSEGRLPAHPHVRRPPEPGRRTRRSTRRWWPRTGGPRPSR